MVLEPASDATLQFKQRVRYATYKYHFICTHPFTLQAEHDALGPSEAEKATLTAVTPPVEPVVKRKKRPKGPNPLSVKKKAIVATTTRVEKTDVGSKRKRHDATDIDVASAQTKHKPKRRRRHKPTSRPVE